MKEIRIRNETALRNSLGIPADVRKVLIFAESSHWDPNWLYTSEEYFDRFVQKQLDQAILGLDKEPRRIYSIECMFFLRMYWDRNPHQHQKIRTYVNNRRLRLTSSGVTTADTLLPSTEAILRDFLLGQEWLRRNGMNQEPKLAYFSDSFGSTTALPSILNAAGFEQTGITRISGMYFPGFELNWPKKYPRPDSSAERLLKEERTLDFIWRDQSGAQVLCHWNAYSYGQGDLLAYRGFSRNYVFPIAIHDPSERNVARRIKQYRKQLEPYSLTPYLFCPIGFDFVRPIPDLVALLDRYNEKRYPSTGLWVMNAGFDDYLDLVNFHRDQLPVIECDPNPYWTGFYSARPALTKRCYDLVDSLLLAEKLSFLPENSEVAKNLPEKLEDTWWTAAVANHHDFITGTSPDRVVYGEQVPWLDEAISTTFKQLEELVPAMSTGPATPEEECLPTWTEESGKVRVETPFYAVVLDKEAGGSIVCAEDRKTASLVLDGLSNDLINYKDSGGLWRMGYEFRGGTWRKRDLASKHPVEFKIAPRNGGLEIFWVSVLRGHDILRSMWFHNDSPIIYFRLYGRAPKRHSVTVSFSTGLSAEKFLMDMPGGVACRACERIYSPTFWPFQHFLHIQDKNTGRGLALYQNLPGAASFAEDGTLQVVALRNAPRERAFHILPVSGNPAKGYERDDFAFIYGLEFTSSGDWRQNKLAEKAFDVTLDPWANPRLTNLLQFAEAEIQLDRTDVWVMANKPANRGQGRIVRLYTLASPPLTVTLSSAQQEIYDAYLCDALERDIQQLDVHDGKIQVRMKGTISTIRLIA
jgi:hypothetical protein